MVGEDGLPKAAYAMVDGILWENTDIGPSQNATGIVVKVYWLYYESETKCLLDQGPVNQDRAALSEAVGSSDIFTVGTELVYVKLSSVKRSRWLTERCSHVVLMDLSGVYELNDISKFCTDLPSKEEKTIRYRWKHSVGLRAVVKPFPSGSHAGCGD